MILLVSLIYNTLQDRTLKCTIILPNIPCKKIEKYKNKPIKFWT